MEPRRNAYDQNEVPLQATSTPPVDITSMYQPYAGSYSESSWHGTSRQSAVPQEGGIARQSTVGSSSLEDGGGVVGTDTKASSDKKKKKKKGETQGSKVGMEQMSHWNAFRFVVYIALRAAQLVISIVCIGFIAHSRSARPSGSVDTTERNTEVAIFAIGGITAVTAAVSIVCHMFARTRKRIEKSRMAWFTGALNFAIFAVWIILVLISVVAVDCSRKTDGAWCSSIKVGLATGLVSAMLALVMVLRSFSVLVRAKRVKLWNAPPAQ
ncbi:hypothetical protein IW140_005146 [Coemansia sp. RSA 1813]|nr:hypothetical protein EV178_005123 [Coemansia sp. RSA 1646]KAJ1768117.1 hypothetical protein LPJ74_005016 [Coemansia sp. RSA 1843]KAJ2088025.1 hypothetical protein IW138_004533 [Coemansia sp. RSA 986]KAJ2211956.1 hypothetical protein EV179_005063 [Coemansia sp. RSA 487]KAJ2565864.1 hypothetical protein IW140_005146 [Coemansia sp. RSA 1813]